MVVNQIQSNQLKWLISHKFDILILNDFWSQWMPFDIIDNQSIQIVCFDQNLQNISPVGTIITTDNLSSYSFK